MGRICLAVLIAFVSACRSKEPIVRAPPADIAGALERPPPEVGAVPAIARRLGFDSVRSVRSPEGSCYMSTRYTVFQLSLHNSVGSDLFVRVAPQDSQLACRPDSMPGDIVLRNRFADYFGGLKGDLLFINSTTGPGDALSIYDLRERRFVFELRDYAIESWPDTMTVRLWRETNLVGREVAGICPDTMQGGIDSLWELDLRTFTLAAVGKSRCAFRQ